jgi:RimJ/RimL family protein N-acetyltransferase
MNLRYRQATEHDLDLYHGWANDPAVRAQSFNQGAIPYDTHCAWFRRRVAATDGLMLVVEEAGSGEPVGQVRFEDVPENATVGLSIAASQRGKGLAAEMLSQATAEFQRRHPVRGVRAQIRLENTASRRAFEKAGYNLVGQELVAGGPSVVFEHRPAGIPLSPNS